MAGETIVQLGAGAWMRHTIRALRRGGFRVLAIDKDPSAPAFADADASAVVDIVDDDAIERWARALPELPALLLVVNGAGVVSGARASARLGLPALPVEVAERAQDKAASRSAWSDAGLPQPDHRVVASAVEIADAARSIGMPVVVKPSRRWGSRGVTRASDATDLAEAVASAAAETDGPFIVEACLDGTEVSVEGLIRDGVAHVLAVGDKEMQPHPRHRVGLVLRYPSALPTSALARVDQVVKAAVRALGIRRGAFDAECMVDGDEVRLLEINPRPGGGHILGQIVEAVSGVDMPVAYAELMLGRDPPIAPRWQRGVCYRFFSPPPGIFRAVHGVEAARGAEGVLDFGFAMRPGTLVGPVAADAERPGFVVATGEDRGEADRRADDAIARLVFDVEPA